MSGFRSVCLWLAASCLLSSCARSGDVKPAPATLPGYTACRESGKSREDEDVAGALDTLGDAAGIEVTRNGYTWRIFRNEAGVSAVQVSQLPDSETWTVHLFSPPEHTTFVLTRESGTDWSLQQILPEGKEAVSETGEWKSMIRELLFPGLPESSLEAAPEKSGSVSNEWVLSFTGLDGVPCQYRVTVNACGYPDSVSLEAENRIIWTTAVRLIENGAEIQTELEAIARQIRTGSLRSGQPPTLPSLPEY
ncbi:hypothetical protein [Faecalibaculum rodentium]|uniref:hypothetical protein n=1 Tax=Faecalibaculum rodentium TaxID=1702221 RepID=UPI0023F4B05B|nr:hypothetical protein [Faecalibaculum rodentium]